MQIATVVRRWQSLYMGAKFTPEIHSMSKACMEY